MFGKFLWLEWKAFIRSAAFGANLAIKILIGFFALYFATMFTILGVGLFYILEESGMPPLETVNTFLIYCFAADLILRYFFQKLPVVNVRPLLVLPIKIRTIVNFAMGKSILSAFNILHLFFLIPFSIVLAINDFDIIHVLLWFVSFISLIYINNFIHILINNKNSIFYTFGAIVLALIALQYYGYFNITDYTFPFYQNLYDTYYLFLLPLAAMIFLYVICVKFFSANLRLDSGIISKVSSAKTENFTWLDKFGAVGTFVKNDIRLLKRNKRSRSTVMMSVLFIFYGLLIFNKNNQSFNDPMIHLFAGIFVSGGFLFTFGQFVPSWDSAYYPLMMSQNIPYREYLASKWWLMVIATVISTILASFYLYFGTDIYLLIIVGAIYNIGINSHVVLLGGAFVKTPIDLMQGKAVFGDKQAFNIKTMLLAVPKLLLPLLIYGIGYYIFSPTVGLIIVAASGVLGFAFRNAMFRLIEKIYKTEKYKTIAAYAKTN